MLGRKILSSARGAYLDLPTDSYFDDLQLYRATSTENDVTAQHIADRLTGVPIQRIVDLGCGDGILTKKIIHALDREHLQLRAIDLDPAMVAAAQKNCQRGGVLDIADIQIGDIPEQLPSLLQNSDVVIMVHVNYFLQDHDFVRLIDALPAGTSFVFVVDKEDSVFSQLWSRTARSFWQRARFANKHLSDRDDITISRTVIHSSITNPWLFPRNMRDHLVSFLSYSDFASSSSEQRSWMRNTIKQFIDGDTVRIETSCYIVSKLVNAPSRSNMD